MSQANSRITSQINELKSIADNTLAELKTLKVDEAQVQVSLIESDELNIEGNNLTLLRNTFDQKLSLNAFVDHREASLQSNQLDKDSIKKLAAKAIEVAKSAAQDQYKSLPKMNEQKEFLAEMQPTNLEWMYSCFERLLSEVNAKFPKIILDSSIIKHTKLQKVLHNTNGSQFAETKSFFEVVIMFSAQDGNRSSSFNYIFFTLPESATEIEDYNILDVCGARELLSQASAQTQVKKVSEKFKGDVIITPHCMQDFVGYWMDYISNERMLKKNSPWQNSLGKKIASEKLNLTYQPSYFPIHEKWTDDGFRTQDEKVIENGTLKNFSLNHYAASKLGLKTSQTKGSSYHMQAGDRSLPEMISTVKKGILLCRYSARMPAENGDISGVAKNSYYIENGQIQYPLGETMVSGNLIEMIQNIQEISSESINNGSFDLPWVKVAGLSVS